MARQIILEDREWIEIANSNGEVTGGFYWNPSDLDIVKRCEKVMDFFNHLEVPEGESGTDTLFSLSDSIKQQFDYLISPGASDELFKNANPLTPREDGTFFSEYVLSQLVSFIESELNVRMRKTTARIEKYTKDYRK